jgi:hypothetical protein
MFLGLTCILLTIAHTSGSPDWIGTCRAGELLGTDSARNPCQYFGMMKKRKNLVKPARTTIASVNKEMQKPRLTESVRNDRRDQVVPVAEQPPARSARV